jgi:hypothetical protein
VYGEIVGKTPMTIIQAIMLALMPSMTLVAVLLCKPAFRRNGKLKKDAPVRSRPSKSGAHRPVPSFAGMAMMDRPGAGKTGRDQAPMHRR